jgi:hypothetical protein
MIPILGLKAYEELRSMLAQWRLEPGTQLVNRKLADGNLRPAEGFVHPR